ncbi:ATPase ASNA1 [Dirofilaria immitis]|nr:ATPase ASNA1 [Dirofilaria immitis]
MDPQQQRLLAQILQQPEQKTLQLKEYQATTEHLQQHVQNFDTATNNFWFSLLAMQRNEMSYPSLSQNLSSVISSSATCSRDQVSPGFSSVVDTNYLPAIAPSTLSLSNTSRNAITTADNTPWIAPAIGTVRYKTSDFRIPTATTAAKVVESAQMTVIKRAKVIVIEQKNQEPLPSCSFNDSNRSSTLKRIDQKRGKIKELDSNVYEERKDKPIECGGANAISNHYVKMKKNEEDEDAQYVDVESVEEKLDSKEQKKSLIEFYRKVKSIRMSYAREDMLICQICEQKVQNSDSLILIHLYGHAEVMPYRCKMCGASECQLERMYAHIKQGHPNKDPSITYENRRNMAQLISLLRTCFPRNITKTKTAYFDLIDKMYGVVKEKSLAKLTCLVCSRKISTRKKSFVRHAQAHLHYRCKDCGITMFDEANIIEHGIKKHGIEDPQCTAHYAACINTSDRREIALKNCFGNILGKKHEKEREEKPTGQRDEKVIISYFLGMAINFVSGYGVASLLVNLDREAIGVEIVRIIYAYMLVIIGTRLDIAVMEDLEPTLQNVINQTTLKWIFVGGKGVCSLAIQLAKARRSVLIISTDPAHNISDAFAQKFSKTPTAVNGFNNLYAMEIEANIGNDAQIVSPGVESSEDMISLGRQVLQEMVGGLPGIDEAMSFSQMMKLIQSMDFDVVVFDTAPTGHTLRLLQFPMLIENSLGKLIGLQSSFAPLMIQMGGMLGLGEISADDTTNKLKETLDVVRKINSQFKDPTCLARRINQSISFRTSLHSFAYVSPNFCLYETERLIQELTKQNIDTHNIIVNQLLYPEEDENGCVKCKKCLARYGIQKKYLEQIADLYEDFNVTRLPLLESEVRGPEQLRNFSRYLIVPYDSNSNTMN